MTAKAKFDTLSLGAGRQRTDPKAASLLAAVMMPVGVASGNSRDANRSFERTCEPTTADLLTAAADGAAPNGSSGRCVEVGCPAGFRLDQPFGRPLWSGDEGEAPGRLPPHHQRDPAGAGFRIRLSVLCVHGSRADSVLPCLLQSAPSVLPHARNSDAIPACLNSYGKWSATLVQSPPHRDTVAVIN
jgi:hypothetical protein